MSVYVMAGVNIDNAAAYEEYGQRARASLVEHNVKVLAVCDAPVNLEGTNPYQRYVLLEFPDQAAVDAWYGSQTYQDAIPFRQANARTGFLVAVPGLG